MASESGAPLPAPGWQGYRAASILLPEWSWQFPTTVDDTHDSERGAEGQPGRCLLPKRRPFLPWPGSHLRIIMGSDYSESMTDE